MARFRATADARRRQREDLNQRQLVGDQIALQQFPQSAVREICRDARAARGPEETLTAGLVVALRRSSGDDEDRYLRKMEDPVSDTAENETLEARNAPGAEDDHGGTVSLGGVED